MATSTFAQSHEVIGLQIADIVAGVVTRYFGDGRQALVCESNKSSSWYACFQSEGLRQKKAA
jgi:hypothetical protein